MVKQQIPTPLHFLPPGSHVCHIYETDKERQQVTTALLSAGVRENQKLVILGNDLSPVFLQKCFHESNLEMEPLVNSGQLEILHADEVCLHHGVFSPMHLMRFLSGQTQRALEEGWSACRFFDEMTWMLTSAPSTEQSQMYEEMAHTFFNTAPCLKICQFDRRTSNPRALLQAFSNHPLIIRGTDVYDNFYFTPPAPSTHDYLPASQLDKMLDNLSLYKAAQEELHLTRFWVENASDAILWLNHDGYFVYANRTACQVFGYSQEELRKKNLMEIDPNYTGPEWRRYWEESRPDDVLVYESLYIDRNGRPIPVEVKASLLVYNDQSYICAIARDISERKRAEEVLQISELKYRTLVEGIRDYAIYTLDVDGNVTGWNAGAERLYGYTEEEILNKNILQFFVPRDVERNLPGFEMDSAARNGVFETQGWRLRKDGTQFWGHTVTTSLHDPEGQLYGFVRVMRDMTEKKLAEDERRSVRRSMLDEF